MIHLQPFTQNRQAQLDFITSPAKDQTKVNRLGGSPRAQSVKQPIRTYQQSAMSTPTNQQAVFTFSSSNPFYHMHQAMHQQPTKTTKTQPTQKCFQDVIREVHEMKELCQKLLTSQKQEHQQDYHKTLIIDLQKLQTNRVDLEEVQGEMYDSHLSINGQMMEGSGLCLHAHCEEISSVLERAIQRLDDLEQGNQRLEKVLVQEKMSKETAESENLCLRKEIARADEQKCAEIKRLRQEIEKMKRQKENSPALNQIYQCGHKSMRKMQPEQRPVLSSLQPSSNIKQSILIPTPHQEETPQHSIKNLKHFVYL